jgi:hypothetical protein
MKLQYLTFGFILTFLWVMMIVLGSIILETFMVYPNIFHNPPESLATTMTFMKVSGPDDFSHRLASSVGLAARARLCWDGVCRPRVTGFLPAY